ncbi:MAG: hypothetical protein SGARI_006855, partial [Bacillariaceae sp.]
MKIAKTYCYLGAATLLAAPSTTGFVPKSSTSTSAPITTRSGGIKRSLQDTMNRNIDVPENENTESIDAGEQPLLANIPTSVPAAGDIFADAATLSAASTVYATEDDFSKEILLESISQTTPEQVLGDAVADH